MPQIAKPLVAKGISLTGRQAVPLDSLTTPSTSQRWYCLPPSPAHHDGIEPALPTCSQRNTPALSGIFGQGRGRLNICGRRTRVPSEAEITAQILWVLLGGVDAKVAVRHDPGSRCFGFRRALALVAEAARAKACGAVEAPTFREGDGCVPLIRRPLQAETRPKTPRDPQIASPGAASLRARFGCSMSISNAVAGLGAVGSNSKR